MRLDPRPPPRTSGDHRPNPSRTTTVARGATGARAAPRHRRPATPSRPHNRWTMEAADRARRRAPAGAAMTERPRRGRWSKNGVRILAWLVGGATFFVSGVVLARAPKPATTEAGPRRLKPPAHPRVVIKRYVTRKVVIVDASTSSASSGAAVYRSSTGGSSSSSSGGSSGSGSGPSGSSGSSGGTAPAPKPAPAPPPTTTGGSAP